MQAVVPGAGLVAHAGPAGPTCCTVQRQAHAGRQQSRVAGQSDERGGGLVDLPEGSEEVEAGDLGDPVALADEAPLVGDGQVDPAEVLAIARRPEDRADVLRLEVERLDDRRLVVGRRGLRGRRAVQAGRPDDLVAGFLELLGEEPIGRGKVASKVAGEADALTIDADDAAEERRARQAESAQVDLVTTAMAGELRVPGQPP